MDPVMTTVELPKLTWSPLLTVVVLAFGTAISFLTAYVNHTVSIYLPFISETGAHSPAVCIFSFTLIMGSAFGCIVVCYRNLLMRQLLAKQPDRVKLLNNISAVFGIISWIGLAGVAAVPMSTVLWLHLVAAGVHFTCALIYLLLESFNQNYVPEANAILRKVRLLLCGMLMLFLLMLVIFFPWSYSEWKKSNIDHPPAIKTPEDEFFGIMFSSALFEWLLYVTFMSYILSFIFEFRGYRLVVGLIPDSQKNDQ